MDAPALRDAARQTAEDFEWLEAHCRARADLARHAGELRLAAAITRNVIGPAVENISPPPLFIAVVGGAGTGKSTIVNLLVGSVVAEANPQAGYTRHPSAFVPNAMNWPSHLGFIGPLRRLERDSPANVDEDVYQVRKLPAGDSPLHEFIVWDCPDMTTWASSGYTSRLLEVAALADIIVFVASDERYNDEVPTQFLQLLLRGGKAVAVALTKMNDTQVAALTDHFRREVLEKIAAPEVSANVPIVAVPFMSVDERKDPASSTKRAALLNQVLALAPNAVATRNRTVANGAKFLEASSTGLLEVARTDLAELSAWTHAVASGQQSFLTRYRNEYLSGEPFQRFERTRDEIVKMLELPGRGRAVSATLQSLRMPVEWLWKRAAHFLSRPPTPNLPERTVLSSAMAAWLDSLQAEALRRANAHPQWKQLAHAFDAGLKGEATQQFEAMATTFERQETGDLEAAARHLADDLAKHPTRLTMARAATVALQVLFVLIALWYGVFQISFWNLLWLVPLAAFLGHGAADLFVRWQVERERTKARTAKETLLTTTITTPLATWLEERPLAGGSSTQRLQSILHRVPVAVRALAAAVTKS